MKNKSLIIILITSLILLVGTFLVCPNPSDVCLRYDEFSVFLILFSAPIFLLSLILLFRPEQVFRSWKHFTYWWIPISALFIIGAPTSSSSGLDGFSMGIDRESITWFFAVLFLVISLVLIVVKTHFYDRNIS